MARKTKTELITLVKKISDNYKNIISRDVISQYPELDWKNGNGDRFARKLFNYTVIRKSGKSTTYSYNDDKIEDKEIDEFKKKIEKSLDSLRGIIGIKIHSERIKKSETRDIRKDIDEHYKKLCCVVCGSKSDLACDHKNDLYDDPRVLKLETQKLEDFQTLCRSCNLRKRSWCIKEKKLGKFISAATIPMLAAFTHPEVTSKKDTYWYDPVAYCKKLKELNSGGALKETIPKETIIL
jgi:hypothetical protein